MRQARETETLDVWSRATRAKIELERAVGEIRLIEAELASRQFVDVKLERQGHFFLWTSPADDRIGVDTLHRTMEDLFPPDTEVEVTITVRTPEVTR